jgi:DNA segregation ATPase FtsK/SpoIIIE, S-DNA-T family
MGKPRSNRRVVRRGGGAPRNGIARDVGAVLLLALAAVSALGLATFSSLDGALIARDMAPANLCGPLGHRAAAALYGVLGFSALVLPVAFGAAALRLFRGAPPQITIVSAAAHLVLML